MGDNKFYYVIGPNENIHAGGRFDDYEAARDFAEMWARNNSGVAYYVLAAISKSIEGIEVSVITTAL